MKKVMAIITFIFFMSLIVINVHAFTSNDELLKTIKNDEVYQFVIDGDTIGNVAINGDELIFNYTYSGYKTVFKISDNDIILVKGNTTTDGKIIDSYFVSSVIRSVALLNGNTKEEIDSFTSDNVSFNDYTYDKDGLELITTTFTEEEVNDNTTITITYEEINSFKIKKNFKIGTIDDSSKDTRKVTPIINKNTLTISGDYNESDKCNIYLSEEKEALLYPMYKTVNCKDVVLLDELGSKTYYIRVAISTSNTWSDAVVYNYVKQDDNSEVTNKEETPEIKEGEVENPDTGMVIPFKEVLIILSVFVVIFVVSHKKYFRRI